MWKRFEKQSFRKKSLVVTLFKRSINGENDDLRKTSRFDIRSKWWSFGRHEARRRDKMRWGSCVVCRSFFIHMMCYVYEWKETRIGESHRPINNDFFLCSLQCRLHVSHLIDVDFFISRLVSFRCFVVIEFSSIEFLTQSRSSYASFFFWSFFLNHTNQHRCWSIKKKTRGKITESRIGRTQWQRKPSNEGQIDYLPLYISMNLRWYSSDFREEKKKRSSCCAIVFHLHSSADR